MLVFTFHHREAAAWQALSAALQTSKFTVTAVCPVRAEGVSGFHSYGGTPKWDAVICCRSSTNSAQADVWQIKTSVKEIVAYERYWTARLKRSKLPWNDADQTSFAYSLVLKEIVNFDLAEELARTLFEKVAARYLQSGVSPSIPYRELSA